MKAYLRADGGYYEGDQRETLDVEVPKRPSHWHSWSGAAWVFDRLAFVDHVREQRNELLRRTDWTRLDDVELTSADRASWAAYRRALRDMPEKLEKIKTPNELVWPRKPV